MAKALKYYVFSTLTAGQVYTRTVAGANDLPRTVGEVYIAGGSNVSDKYLRTPIGVMTPVTEEELAILQENPVFKLHVENGFLKIEDKPHEPEKVAADMVTRDESAPLVDGDFAPDQQPVVNKEPEKPTPPHVSNKSSRRA